MTERLKGVPLDEARSVFGDFHRLLVGEPGQEPDCDRLGRKLCIFRGVCEFPARVKCASLPWHTLKAALDGEGGASTE
jgi:nitrogen fixation NifU-like protein